MTVDRAGVFPAYSSHGLLRWGHSWWLVACCSPVLSFGGMASGTFSAESDRAPKAGAGGLGPTAGPGVSRAGGSPGGGAEEVWWWRDDFVLMRNGHRRHIQACVRVEQFRRLRCGLVRACPQPAHSWDPGGKAGRFPRLTAEPFSLRESSLRGD